MKNRNIFLKNLIFKINSKSISTCYDKSDAVWHYELTVISTDQLAILHRTYQGGSRFNKKEMAQNRILTYSDELMAHLKVDLCFETTHSLLLLKNGSIRKNILP